MKLIKIFYWASFLNALLVSNAHCQIINIGIWEKYDKYSLPAQNVYVNDRELKNGKDDDGDGYIDNINGIGFDSVENIVPEYFYCNTQNAEDYDHGTAVANIIIQNCPNALLYGVGFVPTTARLRSLGILSKSVAERQAGLADEFIKMQFFVNESLAYFAKNNCKTVNISWGLCLNSFMANNQNLGNNPAEREKQARLWLGNFKKLLTEGFKKHPKITFVVAVGNEGLEVNKALDVPGSIQLQNVIRVGALDAVKKNRADFSNYGKGVIYAPGTDINCNNALKQKEINSGTSFAAPIITARIAKKLAVRQSKRP